MPRFGDAPLVSAGGGAIVSLRKQQIIGAVMLVLSVVLGLAAPEPSTATLYRAVVFIFIGLRVASLALLCTSALPEAASAEVRGSKTNRATLPLFVRDSAFGLG
ncbi:MAG: hypothetical protein ACE5JL_15330 [Dehalococcoidia bacterium]